MSPDKSEPRVYTVGALDYEGFHFRDEEDKYTDDVPVGEKVVLKSSYDKAIQLKDAEIKLLRQQRNYFIREKTEVYKRFGVWTSEYDAPVIIQNNDRLIDEKKTEAAKSNLKATEG